MERKHIITLGGLPGSGKSTVRKLLAEKLGYKTFSTGDFVRNLAVERNMSLEEFNELIARDKSIDVLIDSELERIEREDDHYVIDSHLAFHFVPSGFSVFLTISLEKSAERIFHDSKSPERIKVGDTMKDLEETLVRTRKRIDNHIERYTRHYGIDPYLEEHYDYVINTEKDSLPHIVEKVHDAYTGWLAQSSGVH